MYQATRICRALRDNPNENRFGLETEHLVRFAAMAHDTSHGPFSHTSEQYFSCLDGIEEVQREHPQLTDCGAGEVLSWLIVRSPAFVDLVGAVSRRCKVELDIETMAQMITGTAPQGRTYLSEIIHGPFDADKLDYMHRDGMFSGLKLNVDTDRLYASVDVVSQGGLSRLAGSVAGTTPLTQIMFNKMLLYTSMYHHHKVRAVDCMLWAAFRLAVESGETIGGRTVADAADFLYLTDDRVLTPELSSHADIQALVASIRDRRVWKRALVLSRATVPPEMHEEAGDSPEPRFPGLMRLAGNRRLQIEERRRLSRMMWEEAGRPCKEHQVWLDVPKLPTMDESERMWIRTPGVNTPMELADLMPIAQWVELYGNHQWRAHVFCPVGVRRKVNAAAQAVLGSELGLEVNDLATQYAHIDDE